MGCGKSKIKRINLSPDNIKTDVKLSETNGMDTMSGKVNGRIDRPNSSGLDMMRDSVIPGETQDEATILPNRLLLSAIPVSDLGDSLDSRHLSESLNMSQSLGGGFLGNRTQRYSHSYIYKKLLKLLYFQAQIGL